MPNVLITSKDIERISSQGSTPKGRRDIIVIGDVNGIIDAQNSNLLSACPAVMSPIK